jgi:hypothetical protein
MQWFLEITFFIGGIGRRAIFHLAFDSAADNNKAMRCLKKIS